MPEPAQPALFQRATPDGSKVLFFSDAKLTTEGTSGGGARDLYRYDTDSGDLTDLMAVAGKIAKGLGVLGASDDGSRVYFAAFGDGLAAGAPDGQTNIYLWRDGHLQFIVGMPNVNSGGVGPDAVNWATVRSTAIRSPASALTVVCCSSARPSQSPASRPTAIVSSIAMTLILTSASASRATRRAARRRLTRASRQGHLMVREGLLVRLRSAPQPLCRRAARLLPDGGGAGLSLEHQRSP